MTPYYQDSACTIYHGDCREMIPFLLGYVIGVLLSSLLWLAYFIYCDREFKRLSAMAKACKR